MTRKRLSKDLRNWLLINMSGQMIHPHCNKPKHWRKNCRFVLWNHIKTEIIESDMSQSGRKTIITEESNFIRSDMDTYGPTTLNILDEKIFSRYDRRFFLATISNPISHFNYTFKSVELIQTLRIPKIIKIWGWVCTWVSSWFFRRNFFYRKTGLTCSMRISYDRPCQEYFSEKL